MLDRQGSYRTVLGRIVSYTTGDAHRPLSPFDRLRDYDSVTFSSNSYLQDFSHPLNLAAALGNWQNSTSINISIAGTLPFDNVYNSIEKWPPDRIKGEMFNY